MGKSLQYASVSFPLNMSISNKCKKKKKKEKKWNKGEGEKSLKVRKKYIKIAKKGWKVQNVHSTVD